MPLDNDLEPGASGDAVAELHEVLLKLAGRIAEARPNGSGAERGFERERAARSFGPVTAAILRLLQGANGLLPTGAADARTRALLKRLLERLDAPPRPEPQPEPQPDQPTPPRDAARGTVAGTVMDARGRRLGGVAVSLAAVALGRRDVLARTESGADGRFALSYGRAEAAKIGRGLQLDAASPHGGKATSPVLFDAPPRVEAFDLVLPEAGPAAGEPSDFERERKLLLRAAKAAGLSLAEIGETPEWPEATLLAEATGLAPARVALHVAALRIERDSKGAVPAEIAYALGAAGVPFGAAALGRLPAEGLAAALDRSIRRGHAPASVRDQLKPAVAAAQAALGAAGVARLAEGAAGRTLDSVLGRPIAARFFALAAGHDGDRASFWEKAKGDAELAPHADTLDFALQAMVVTGGQPEAVAMLDDLRRTGRIAGLESLAAWTRHDWEKQLAAANVPPPDTGTRDDAAARRRYAAGIDQVIEAAHPRAYLRHRVAASALAGRDGIVAFLDKAEGFVPQAGDLQGWLRDHPGTAALLDDAGRGTLAALHRVQRVTGRAEPAVTLVADGLTSARRIAALGPKAFARRYATAFGGAGPAFAAHAAAGTTAVAAAELMLQTQSAQQSSIMAIPSGPVDPPAFPNWATLFGTEDGCACRHCSSVTGPGAYLVDALHFLSARDARAAGRSALDMLLAPGRRPDLAELELTCENTDTVLPYVDLVNEALEDAVAPPPAFAPVRITAPIAAEPGSDRPTAALRTALNVALGLVNQNAAFAIGAEAQLVSRTEGRPWQGARLAWRIEDRLASYTVNTRANGEVWVESRSRATLGPTAERLMRPQYENRAAHARLAGAFYPWTLPFDRPVAEARAALGAIGRSRAELLEEFAAGTAATRRRRADVARERLGLGRGDVPLVVWTADAAAVPGFDPARPWEAWGFGAATATAAAPVADPEDSANPITDGSAWHAILARQLDILLERGQLRIEQVLALLDTHYVNPPGAAGRQIAIVSTDAQDPATCRAAKLSLQGLDAAAAVRIARLARLSLRSGLDLREVDRALSALGATQPDAAFLDALAALVALRDRLGTGIETLSAMVIPPAAPRLSGFWAPAGPARLVDHVGGETRLAPTFYERLLRPARDPALAWFPADPASLAGRDLADGTAALAACFGLPVQAVAALMASALVLPGGTAASLGALARLHRHAELLRRLGLTPADYLRALRLWDADPFADPQRLRDFVAAVDAAAASPLGIADLAWLCRREGGPPEAVLEAEDARLLDTLRTALAGVAAEMSFVPLDAPEAAPTLDPDGSVLRARLGAIGVPATLAEAALAALADTTERSVTDAALPALDPATVPLPAWRVPLAALPAGVDPSAPTAGALTFAGGELVATRLLTEDEAAVLRAASADAAWRAALADLLARQAQLAGRARFDGAARRLSFTGVMGPAWRAHLDGLSADPAWRAAVATLHDTPRRVLRRVLRHMRPVAVAQPLPTGLPVKLPPSLAGRLLLDTSVAPAVLRLSGPLLDAEVAALQAAAPGAAPDLVAFRTAIAALAAAAEAVVPSAAERLMDDAALDAILAQPVDAAERHRLVLREILPKVADVVAATALDGALSAALGLPAPTAQRLALREITVANATRSAAAALRDPAFVGSPPALVPNRTAFPLQHEALRRLRHAALLVGRLGLTEADLVLLARFQGWPLLASLPADPPAAAAPFTAADAMAHVAYAAARDRVPGGRETLAALTAAAVAPGASAASLTALAAQRMDLPATEVALLAGAGLLGLTLPDDIRAGTGLIRLVEGCARLVATGLGAATIAGLRAAAPGPDSGRAAIAAVARGMEPAQWREDGRAIMDRIRMATRDALLAYLLARGRPAEGGVPRQRWRDAAELFGHLLIDVEMGACMETSRLRQAMSSVQLFVQRCQLGLEPEVAADAEADDGWLQWQWMRDYRVWEANRKVFLWPENLLRTEFMDVKSPLLRQLEGALGQGEVTIEGAARAMLGYLEGLREIANLEPLTMAVEPTDGRAIHHVIAASRTRPRTLHYRRREDTRIWSPWEKLELEITSEHLLLHVWNGRPFLFWLDFQKRAEDGQLQGSRITARELFDVTLCWSELTETGWTAQRQSAEKLVLTVARAGADTLRVVFRITEASDGALWILYRHAGGGGAPVSASGARPGFRIEYPHAEPQLESRTGFRLPPAIPGARHRRSGQEIRRNVGSAHVVHLPHRISGTAAALRAARRTLRIAMPPELARKDFEEGVFLLADRQRGFVVTPWTERRPGKVWVTPVFPDLVAEKLKPWWKNPPVLVDPFDIVDPLPDPADPWGPLLPDFAGGDGLAINPVVLFEKTMLPQVRTASGLMGPNAETAPFSAIRQGFRDDRLMARRMTTERETQLAERQRIMALPMRDMAGLPDPDAEAGFGMRTLSLRAAPQLSRKAMLGADAAAEAMLSIHAGNEAIGWIVPAYDVQIGILYPETIRRYRFEPFYHPHVDTLIHVLRKRGVEAMLRRDVQLRPHAHAPRGGGTALAYRDAYDSVDAVVTWSRASEVIDFDYDAAYAVYNWELFYHVPMMIAERLAESQRFDAALRWLQAIFDPTDQTPQVRLADGTFAAVGAARHWQVKPLFENSLPGPGGSDATVERERIERILRVLASDAAPDRDQRLTDADRQDLQRFKDQVEEMRRKPFRPHAIARLRTSAYQRATVMKYVEILLRWGDQLFRRDTMETVNAATQLYLVAASFRGREAAVMPPRAVAAPQTYAALAPRLDVSGNALVEIEAFVTPNAAPNPLPQQGLPPPAMLAFCVPRNEKLDRIWAEVADRLFKIRNCLNIDGVARRLALFEPPIDPELLARAVAAGVDLGAAVAGITAPAPRHRFRFLADQALDLAQEVRALGQALLATLEKHDAETLAQLKAHHETRLLARAEEVRKLAVSEAEANIESLRAARQGALERLRHFRRLLSEDSLADPAEGEAIVIRPARSDTATRNSEVFRLLGAMLGQIPGASTPPGVDLGGIPVNSYEDFDLALTVVSQGLALGASAFDVMAGVAGIVPNFNVQPWGIGATFGGSNVGSAFSAAASGLRGVSGAAGLGASMAAKAAQYATRADDWILQRNLAAREVMATDRQIIAAEIRRQLARRELENQKAQLADQEAFETALAGKFTNDALYAWMVGRLSDLHFRMHQLAHDWALRAERAAQNELHRPQLSFIRFGQWDGLRKGLLAGESLAHDIRRMKMSYEELDLREEEMTRHVSLARLDPEALVRLRLTGRATFTVPEALFDLDVPGQFMRRIRTVAVTIPCVAGPYTGVHCRLTLLRSTVRVSPRLRGQGRAYARDQANDDDRFVDHLGQVRSIVTSTARNDDGLFDTAAGDQRLLPFEGLGAIGEWRVELPRTMPAFDYATISDLVLHIGYSARNGGDPLRAQAEAELVAALDAVRLASGGTGLMRRISLRHEAPTAWAAFVQTPVGTQNQVELPIGRAMLPFFVGARPVSIRSVLVLPRIARERLAELSGALAGELRPLGEADDAAVPLAFAPWLRPVLRAGWEGAVDLGRKGPGGAVPSPWLLRLWQSAPSIRPVPADALEDVELLLRYTI